MHTNLLRFPRNSLQNDKLKQTASFESLPVDQSSRNGTNIRLLHLVYDNINESELSEDISEQSSQQLTLSVTVLSVLLALFIIFVVIVLYMKKRRKRRKEAKERSKTFIAINNHLKSDGFAKTIGIIDIDTVHLKDNEKNNILLQNKNIIRLKTTEKGNIFDSGTEV